MGNEPIAVAISTVLPDTACRNASPVSLEGSASVLPAKPNWITRRGSNRWYMEKRHNRLSEPGRELDSELGLNSYCFCESPFLMSSIFLAA